MKKNILLVFVLLFFSCGNEFDDYVTTSEREKIESKSKSNYQYKNTTTTNKSDSVHYYSFTLDSKYIKPADSKKKVSTSGSCTCGAPNKTGGYCKRKVSVCGTRCWQH